MTAFFEELRTFAKVAVAAMTVVVVASACGGNHRSPTASSVSTQSASPTASSLYRPIDPEASGYSGLPTAEELRDITGTTWTIDTSTGGIRMLINVANDAATTPANCSLVHEPNVKSTWGEAAGALEAAQLDWKSSDGDLAWSGLAMFDRSSAAADSFAKVTDALKQCTSTYTTGEENTQWRPADVQTEANAATWTVVQQDTSPHWSCQQTLRLQANLIAGGLVCSSSPSDYGSEIADLVMSKAIELG